MRKGPFHVVAEVLFLIAHIFKAVIATAMKPCIMNLQSLGYTHCKFRNPHTSSMGVAIAQSQKSSVMPFGAPPFQVRT